MQKEVLSTFFNHLKYERKLSENTIIAYENDINQLQDFLKKTFDVPNILDVEGHFLRSWIISLIEKKEAPTTINRKISCLKSFFKFAMRMEWISKNPTLKLIRPKLPKRLAKDVELPKLLDLKEYLRIQSESNKFEDFRDFTMFMFFYTTGIRRNELLNLKWADIRLESMQIKVLGKGNKERYVPIHSQMYSIILRYKEIFYSTVSTENNYVFLTNNMEAPYPNFVYRTIKEYLKKVTSQTGIGPHTLRHSFATHLLNHGAELNVIKEMLGHSSLAATQVYTNSSIERLKQIHKISHPKS